MGWGSEHVLSMHRALGSNPASRTNGKLYKVVAIFTPSLEGNCISCLSVGSYFTLTLGSDDDQDSLLVTETDLPRCCQGILSVIMCCLLHHKFFPHRIWLYLISSLPRECTQAHTALSAMGACPCGISPCVAGTHSLTQSLGFEV